LVFSICRPAKRKPLILSSKTGFTTVRDLVVDRDAPARSATAALVGSENVHRPPAGRGFGRRLNRATTTAMANLAEAIQGLVNHMRTGAADDLRLGRLAAQQHRDIRRLLEIPAREREQVGEQMALARARRDGG
jgi:hypothetical protein